MCENKEINTTNPVFGTIEKGGFFLRQYVGKATSSDGKEFEIATTMHGEPLIVYGNKMYKLSWNDICNMAEAAGLFKED